MPRVAPVSRFAVPRVRPEKDANPSSDAGLTQRHIAVSIVGWLRKRPRILLFDK